MKKRFWLIVCLLSFVVSWAQNSGLYQTKKIITDSISQKIVLDSVALNNNYFEIADNQGVPLDTLCYKIDFNTATLTLEPLNDTLTVSYLNYPDFLTKTYALYDTKRIVPNKEGAYIFKVPEKQVSTFMPFEGLNTNGSISRGITVGNNQNLVTNSNLDLQIVGNLSDKVQIRASLQDSNVPLQNGG